MALALAPAARAELAPPGAEVEAVAAPAPEGITPFGGYVAGRHAQQLKAYGEAVDYYRVPLAADPDVPELVERVFLLSLGEGRMDEARAVATRALAPDRTSFLARLALATGAAQRGGWGSASALLSEPPRDAMQRVIQPLFRAWVEYGAGAGEAASIAAMQPIVDGKVLVPLRDFHAALIADLADDTVRAEAELRRLLASQERANWRTVETLGSLLERSGRAAEARALYRGFADENPGGGPAEAALARLDAGGAAVRRVRTPADGLAEAFFDIASVLNQGDTMELALLYARFALDMRPDFPLGQLLLGEVLDSQRRWADALAAVRTIPADLPYRWTARLRIAADLAALDRDEEAIAELEAMAAEQPERWAPLVQLGDTLRGRNRFVEAVNAYDRAFDRLGPPQPMHWGLYYSRGIALERSGRWERAEADLKLALSLHPDEPSVLNYLGYSWIDRGERLEEALGMVRRAVELRPEDGFIRDSLGWAFYRLGDFERAAEHLEAAVALRPGDATINDHLGDAYWQAGRRNEARFQWQRALQFGAEPDEAKAIEAKLANGMKPAAGPPARGG